MTVMAFVLGVIAGIFLGYAIAVTVQFEKDHKRKRK